MRNEMARRAFGGVIASSLWVLAHCGGGRSPAGGNPQSGPCPGASCEPAVTGQEAGASDGGSPAESDAAAGDESPPTPGGHADASPTATDGGAPGTTDGGLPPLSVSGNKLVDPDGRVIILRGSSLIDIGSLYARGGQSAAGITTRLDKVAAAGVQGHVVRMPVYPEITYNGGTPTCSPVPYPVGSGPSANCTPKTPLSASDYVSKVLQPAVDDATRRGLYVIIDFHQIDNATTGTSAADATTFWADVAPKFAGYTNVLYELFNEPIDNTSNWAALKPVVQGWIDTVRASAPQNVIVVPSNRWDQLPGDATADPPHGTNLMYTAHIYPSNWTQGFQAQVATAVTTAPVFITEWGYTAGTANGHAWGTSLQALVDGDGASWTAWVTDNAWAPQIFADTALTQLTDFGTLTQSWLATTASSNWVR